MKHEKIFAFLNDPYYRMMLDMSREKRSDEDNKSICDRFRKINTEQLYEICHEHELDGVAGACACSLGLTLPEVWQKEYQRQKERQEYLMNKAIEVCKLMDDNGIPMAVLKNGGIMIGMIHEAVKCPMEDVDSLVRKSDFYRAHEILIANGFQFKFRSEFEFEKLDEAYRDGSTEYFIEMPDGEKIWFELAWRAVAGRWIRPDLEPDTDGFLERSFTPEGTKVHVLSPEDNLLQVCIHTAKHSYVRAPGLRLHMDVDRIIAYNEIDWKLFIEKVKATHVCTSTYLSLYIPSIILRTEIPQWVLEKLRPSNAEMLLNMLGEAGLPHPKQKKFNKLQFLHFQTALYDYRSDIWHTLYPGKMWMKERYNCQTNIQVVRATIIRGLDLIGIRKRKK
jgi:hypothetical protein